MEFSNDGVSKSVCVCVRGCSLQTAAVLKHASSLFSVNRSSKHDTVSVSDTLHLHCATANACHHVD